MVPGGQDNVSIFVVPNRDVHVLGPAQSGEGTDESRAVVVVLDGTETFVQSPLRS